MNAELPAPLNPILLQPETEETPPDSPTYRFRGENVEVEVRRLEKGCELKVSGPPPDTQVRLIAISVNGVITPEAWQKDLPHSQDGTAWHNRFSTPPLKGMVEINLRLSNMPRTQIIRFVAR